MFIVHELEKIMQSLISTGKKGNQKFKITLPDVQRVQVDQLDIFNKVNLRELAVARNELLQPNNHHIEPLNLRAYISSQHYLTTDLLFASSIKTLILDRLATLPERPYPAARLMICDHESYQFLLKFQYSTQKLTNPLSDVSINRNNKFLLHKRPFRLSAVVLLADILDMIDQLQRPIARVQPTGTANFDYTIIKQIFPYLKITDLVVCLGQVGDLRLRTFTLDASMAHQAIQFLTHFARSSHLIELLPIKMKLGNQQHPIYDNVAILRPPDFAQSAPPNKPQPQQAASAGGGGRKTKDDLRPGKAKSLRIGSLVTNPHMRLTLLQLSNMAHRLHGLLGQLDWQLESITYRSDDPDGFSKIFSKILESVVKSSTATAKSSEPAQGQQQQQQAQQPPSPTPLIMARHRPSNNQLSLVPVRVLVLDRFFDLHGLLRHSDRYGPFLEQEHQQQLASGGLADLRLDKLDPLDRVLHFERLTDVLKTILSYSTSAADDTARASSPQDSAKTGFKTQHDYQKTTSGSSVASLGAKPRPAVSSGAIKRHLDAIKIIYASLNEGYLLLLKLESSLASAVARLRNSDEEPLKAKEEMELAERLKRSSLVLKQLISIPSQGNSITPMDVLRVALIWLDTINLFLYLHPDQRNAPVCKSLLETKSAFLTCKEFTNTPLDQQQSVINNESQRGRAKSDIDQVARDNKSKNVTSSLSLRMEEFDELSRGRCGNRATATLEEMIEAFYTRKLNTELYSTLKIPSQANGLIKNVSRNKIVVLVLGSISYDELNRIKLLESELMGRRRKFHGTLDNNKPQQAASGGAGGNLYEGDILTIASGIIRPFEFVQSLSL